MLDYLTDACRAQRRGLPPPSLLPLAQLHQSTLLAARLPVCILLSQLLKMENFNRYLGFFFIKFFEAVMYIPSLIIPALFQSFYFVNRKISNINFEEEIKNFPIFNSSSSKYIELREKIKCFISAVDRNESVSLLLDSDAINQLLTRGKIYNRSDITDIPIFYEIEDGRILEHKLIYPAPLTKYGFSRSVWATWFEAEDSRFIQKWKLVSSTSQPLMAFAESTSIDKSRLLYFIFFPLVASADWEHYGEITAKIRSISIIDRQLYIVT
jgi:hypothetical protein